MAHSSRLICALLISTLAACGGKSVEVDPDLNAAGSSPGGSSQGGSSAGSSRGGTSSTAGTSTGGSGQGGRAGAACAGFDDATGATGSPLVVAIINRTTAAIYLGEDMVSCSPWSWPLFQVSDSSGATLSPPDSCSGSCQSLMDHGVTGCPAICAFPSAVELQPGETLYTSWDGLFRVQRELPQQCIPPDYGAATCQQTMRVQPGTFVFSAVAGRSIDCKTTTGEACAACTHRPDGPGGCTINSALIVGPKLNAVTTEQLDASYGVYGDPSPAPRPLPGDGAEDPIARRMVELVFSD